jgi:hypothetical protein
VNTRSQYEGFILFDNKAVAIVKNVVCCHCCVKFSAARAVSPISSSRAEVERVVCREAVTGSDLEGSTLEPARPGRQHSFDTRV